MIADREVEERLLGSLLTGAMCLDELDAGPIVIQAEDFSTGVHRAIFKVVRQLVSTGEAVDPTLVTTHLGSNPAAHAVDALALKALSGDAKLGPSYAKALRGFRTKREIHSLGQSLQAKAEATEPEALLEELSETVLAMSVRDTSRPGKSATSAVQDAYKAAFSAFKTGRWAVGEGTGFRALDEAVGGLGRGEVTIIAARPGMGKSALVLDVLRSAARRGTPGILFSLEMGERELGQRALASRAQVPLPKLRGGGMTEAEWSRVTACVEDPSESALRFSCQAPLGMPELRAQAIAYRREMGDLGFVAVDYVQLMRGSGQSREQEVAGLSRGLKLLANELQTHVIALSQLNRQVEARENRRPVLSDLRESGALEQDADRVMFVYREGYYNERAPQDRAEIIIAKQRNGACRTVELGFSGQTTSFFDVAD